MGHVSEPLRAARFVKNASFVFSPASLAKAFSNKAKRGPIFQQAQISKIVGLKQVLSHACATFLSIWARRAFLLVSVPLVYEKSTAATSLFGARPSGPRTELFACQPQRGRLRIK